MLLHHILEGSSDHILSKSFCDRYNSHGKKDFTLEINQPFVCVACCSSEIAIKLKPADIHDHQTILLNCATSRRAMKISNSTHENTDIN